MRPECLRDRPRNTAKLPTLLLHALRAGQVHGLGWRFGPRCETTECHICNYNVFVFCNYNVFVFIEVDIGAALQNPQLLSPTGVRTSAPTSRTSSAVVPGQHSTILLSNAGSGPPRSHFAHALSKNLAMSRFV